MRNEDDDNMEDVMDDNPTPKKAKKKAKKTTDDAKKPSKVKKLTKPEPKAAKGKEAKPVKKVSKGNGKDDKPAKPKKVADDVSTIQPDDSVVIKAVRKLKEPTMASQLASSIGVHRRVIRAQLQRLAKDKANGVKMVKDGFNWMVANTAK